MTSTRHEELEYTFEGKDYYLELELRAQLTDESFDHEFGTEHEYGIEMTEVCIETLYDCRTDKEITNKRLIAKIEKDIDIHQFQDSFDIYDFE